MTATPIPRTVAMTVFGDLDTSTLSELPLGRSPIASHVVPASREAGLPGSGLAPAARGGGKGPPGLRRLPAHRRRRAPPTTNLRVTDEETRRPPLAVTEVAPLLADGPLHGLRIGVLHGRLPSDEKDAVMRSFAAGDLDVLVATTVIEVGVDVPNATVMIVLDAERFGVSQLHQLRGRVGRGHAPGLCLLVTDSSEGTPARERLDAVAATVDGFRLAEIDLEQRREGDVLGATQSGRRSHLQLLSLLRDDEAHPRGACCGHRPARRRSRAATAIRHYATRSRPWSTRNAPNTWRRDDSDHRRHVRGPEARHAGRRRHAAHIRPCTRSAVQLARHGQRSSTVAGSSTCTPAAARSAWKPRPVAQTTCCWSSRTRRRAGCCGLTSTRSASRESRRSPLDGSRRRWPDGPLG